MAKYVPDTYTNQWVIYATHRAFRPHDPLDKCRKEEIKTVKKHGYNFKPNCPFCLGNESMTPPEIYRWSSRTSVTKSESDWLVRVIPNKYPISDVHEVVIHSPDHLLDIPNLPLEHVRILFKVFLTRFEILSEKGTVIIFSNKGNQAGESLAHPHSQIVVLPRQVKLEVLSLQPLNNLVMETNRYAVYCPDFSQWPYEIWISLKKFHDPSFIDQGTAGFDTINDEELNELAEILQKMLARLEKKFPHSAYNWYIHPYSPWYLRIIPRFVTRAGFELGTGLIVNIKDPAEAASELRE